MTLEEIRQALLRLNELDALKDSFKAMMSGEDQQYKQEFTILRERIEAEAASGWELQKMENAWAHAWVLLAVKESLRTIEPTFKCLAEGCTNRVGSSDGYCDEHMPKQEVQA